jgi:hypothetical protein
MNDDRSHRPTLLERRQTEARTIWDAIDRIETTTTRLHGPFFGLEARALNLDEYRDDRGDAN